MRFGSGSYDVRRSEGLNPDLLLASPSRTITCTITFLDATEKQFIINRHALGKELLDKVFTHLELVERDFFGLQFLCVVDSRETQKRWLDPRKSVRKQMLCPPYQLFFRVKFYVSDPSKLIEEYTRYHFFLQLRADIFEGRLPCAEGSLALLASYAVQSELGDYNSIEHAPGYLESFKFAPKQTSDFAKRVEELHAMHRRQTPAEAEYNFLDHAKRLDLYGIEQREARDRTGMLVGLGVNSYGIIVFHEGTKINEFPWSNIMKLSFKRKQFFIQIRLNDDQPDAVIIFVMNSPPICKEFWKTCVEHHTFFRLIAPPVVPSKGIFNIGSRYRYSGRTEFQTMEDVKQRARLDRTFQRSHSKSSFLRATFGGVPSSSLDSSRAFTPSTASPDISSRILSGGQSLARRLLGSKRTALLASRLHPLGSSLSAPTPTTVTLSSLPGTPMLGHVDTQTDVITHSPHKQHNCCSNGGSESSAPSLRRRGKETTFGVSEDDSADERSWTPAATLTVTNTNSMQACTSTAPVHHRPPSAAPSSVRKSIPNGYAHSSSSSANNSYHPSSSNHSNSNGYGVYSVSQNGYANGNGTLSRSMGGTVRMSTRGHSNPIHATVTAQSQPVTASPRSSVASFSSHASINGGSPPRSRRSPQSQKSNSPVSEDSVVTVRMKPDNQGRFGFNVKGGADQNYPVIISRVAAGSSADKCHPRLNEGDQVLMVNGKDASIMSHEEIVAYIRKARTSPSGGELVLTIKPNVYRLGDVIDEPEPSVVPESARVAETVPRSDMLDQSLKLLADALKAGKVLPHFEMLYRRNPHMSINDCRHPQNISKNRYRDICPYDATRVILNSSSSGDYINANYVNMEIPASGIVNRYIACQGPLNHTTADFWLMVWEQLCSTIIMLTTTVEKGRVKCHTYWPRLYDQSDYGRLSVRCLKERETPTCAYREFSVRDRTTSEERRITQIQYTAWPDHGVPDDPKAFINFVDEVRRARAGSVEPIIVHCSAGIGRTGVLILMETAACLIEANEPVYPLEIVKIMRDQRAMLVQTPCQYQFVCESILKAYQDGLLKPLAEYQKRN